MEKLQVMKKIVTFFKKYKSMMFLVCLLQLLSYQHADDTNADYTNFKTTVRITSTANSHIKYKKGKVFTQIVILAKQ